jgi:hypothetical protein
VVEADDTMLARFGDSTASLAEYLCGLGFSGEPIREEWHAPSLAFHPWFRLLRCRVLVTRAAESGLVRSVPALTAGPKTTQQTVLMRHHALVLRDH